MTARLVRLLELEGRDVAEVCRRAGVSRDEVTSLSARVPYSVVDALVESSVRERGIADFAVALAGVMDESTYDAAGLVLMSSKTLGEGLERALAYQRLWADGERFTLRPSARGGVLGFEHPGRSRVARAVLAEVAFVETVNAARMLVGPSATAESATFSHERASSLAQVLGVEPIYGAKRNELVLAASLLTAPIRLPEGALARMHEILAQRAVAELPVRTSLASQLCAVCKLEPSAFSLDLAGIAARLRMTRRTLQRRLAAQGTFWTAVVDEARRACVRELELRAAADKEISFLVGYSDPSALARARARWARGARA
jgi:AraC-like DNA-binding protein